MTSFWLIMNYFKVSDYYGYVYLLCIVVTASQQCEAHLTSEPMLEVERLAMKEEAREMFYHAYNAYMANAYPADELLPLSCAGRYRGVMPSRGDIDDVLGNFSLTLVDALDTLAVLGDIEEFERAARLIVRDVSFDTDVVVSVFETNIRILGGLLSGHVLAELFQQLYGAMPWYQGELLTMAQDLGDRLLPAFNTSTGVPFPRVNLRHGMNAPELGGARDTCTSCAGTMILEFATLSRLTGDGVYEEKARRTLDYLWGQRHRSTDLVGTVLNVHSGDWVRRESGVGAGIDSYYEYLLKAHILLGDSDYLHRFNKHYSAVMKYVSQGPMLLDVHMHRPHTTTRNYMDAFLAFWPGLQVLKGDIKPAIETHEMLYQVTQRHHFLPEAFTTDFQVHWGQHPLRPEFVESTYLLHEATGDPYYLRVGQEALRSLQKRAWVPCGYAAVKDVRTGAHEDRMDSFVLSETFKYLYLLFSKPHELPFNMDNFVLTTEAHLLPLSLARASVASVPRNSSSPPLLEVEDPPVDDADGEFSHSCPNAHSLYPGEQKFAESIRKPLKNYVDSVCPSRGRHAAKRKLRASEFRAGDSDQLQLLADMGIKIVELPGGKVQLLQTSAHALSRDDAEEGVLFMQEMIDLSNTQQAQPDHPPRLVTFAYCADEGSNSDVDSAASDKITSAADAEVDAESCALEAEAVAAVTETGPAAAETVAAALEVDAAATEAESCALEAEAGAAAAEADGDAAAAQAVGDTSEAGGAAAKAGGDVAEAESCAAAVEAGGDTAEAGGDTAEAGAAAAEDIPAAVSRLDSILVQSIIAGPAQFGLQLEGDTMVEGEVLVAAPFRACGALENGHLAKGKIVVVERGDCLFVDKARVLQGSGAVGGIVVDNAELAAPDEGGQADEELPMFAMSGDSASEDVTIPLVFVYRRPAQQLLRAAAAPGHLTAVLSDGAKRSRDTDSLIVSLGDIAASRDTHTPVVQALLRARAKTHEGLLQQQDLGLPQVPSSGGGGALGLCSDDLVTVIGTADTLAEGSASLLEGSAGVGRWEAALLEARSADDLIAALGEIVRHHRPEGGGAAGGEGDGAENVSTQWLLQRIQHLLSQKGRRSPQLLRVLLSSHVTPLLAVLDQAAADEDDRTRPLAAIVGQLIHILGASSAGDGQQLAALDASSAGDGQQLAGLDASGAGDGQQLAGLDASGAGDGQQLAGLDASSADQQHSEFITREASVDLLSDSCHSEDNLREEDRNEQPPGQAAAPADISVASDSEDKFPSQDADGKKPPQELDKERQARQSLPQPPPLRSPDDRDARDEL
ncbi:ER degradation-enhancing alpha-mannosidase-like protein 3 isoform X2 [Hyalella azteca]|uniref:alpha-1,2-Mannosidase n=1 Tax=Hyalella azteca TaxID=294128 RepID=A0A8B7NX32_HYAAZ|nr:ER degradation-enhancing alpha-mannosidase-like protein 3 isoform X1 [Hyalella azteca]XP_047738690.1 ER degradation-enhancing alpha-mannosidase-like protein 3 isoform X2 [Hyalella azteca]